MSPISVMDTLVLLFVLVIVNFIPVIFGLLRTIVCGGFVSLMILTSM